MNFRKKFNQLLNLKPTPPSHDRNRATVSPSPGPLVPSTPSELSLPANLAPVLAITPPSEEGNHVSIRSPGLSTPGFAQEYRVDYHAPDNSPGILAGAHDFAVNNPIMVENQQLEIHYHGVHHPPRERSPVGSSQQMHSEDKTKYRKEAVEQLKKHAIAGSEYNSGERDPPPRCHPDTRMGVRGKFRARIEEPSGGARVVWIHGPAGVGKSAIMQTIIEELSPHFICGTLFFSRSNRRENPMKAFATLAYGLAVNQPEYGLTASQLEYRDYIATCLEIDPCCLEKSLEAQFEILFTTPFLKNHVQCDSKPWLMFIDGLDECLNPEDSDKQSRIFDLIGNHASEYAGRTPFIWVIASRPEENLKAAWSEIGERFQGRSSDLWEVQIPADSDEAIRDVERGLHRDFERIRKSHIDLPPHWPSETDFSKISKKSGGYFIFSTTVARYIAVNPFKHLARIIQLIDRTEGEPIAADKNPFRFLDLLYSEIMKGVGEDLPVAKSLLGFFCLSSKVIAEKLVVGRSEPSAGLVEACNILGLDQHEAYHALRKLQSVLICPPPKDALSEGVRFFHASFPEFFLEPERSGTYHIDSNQVLMAVWRRYTHIIKQSREATGIDLTWRPDDDSSIIEHQERLLSKARNGWIKILTTKPSSPPNLKVGRFQVDAGELIEAFQSLGLAFLSGDILSVSDFMQWLDVQAPGEVYKEIVSESFSLGQLNKERLFKCLCSSTKPRYQRTKRDPQGDYVESINLTKTIADCKRQALMMGNNPWVEAEKKLWVERGEFHALVNKTSVRVTVIRSKSSESCAIIGPLSTQDFYVLPYSTV